MELRDDLRPLVVVVVWPEHTVCVTYLFASSVWVGS